MDFRAAVAWLDAHLGGLVNVTVKAAADGQGNSGAVLVGVLRAATRPWGTIDSRGGELHAYDVGSHGGFALLEGDFRGAELLEEEGILFMDMTEVQINVGIGDASAG